MRMGIWIVLWYLHRKQVLFVHTKFILRPANNDPWIHEFNWLNSRISVREFTGFCEQIWCVDTHLPHVKSRVFPFVKIRVICTCIYIIVVREFARFCEQIWCVDTWLSHVKSRVFCSLRLFTCVLYVNLRDSVNKCGVSTRSYRS